MAPEDTYGIAEFKENLAVCIEKVTAGRVIYIQNHKRRGYPVVACLVSAKDAAHLEVLRAVNAQAP